MLYEAIERLRVLINSHRDTRKLHSMPKLHTLLVHVPDFVSKENFWALGSEQGIESLHSLVNRDIQNFKNMGPNQRSLKILKESAIRNYLFDKDKFRIKK